MIDIESYSEEHLESILDSKKNTPGLVRRAVYALGLLEALVRVGLPFTFKGGTCLMLLSNRPRRLSTDVDITVEPGTDVDAYLEQASHIFPFIRVAEDDRSDSNKDVKRQLLLSIPSHVKKEAISHGIDKKHFNFYYAFSNIYEDGTNILLDILYEKFHYTETVFKEIRSDLLITEEPYLKVRMPSVNCLLADKLTAYAPHTCGIALGTNKELNIMKQYFDIGTLLDEFTDFEQVRINYFKTVQYEIHYSGNNCTPEDCLWDTIKAATCIASNGKSLPDEFRIYIGALDSLRAHIYQDEYKITGSTAYKISTKIIYAAACLLTGNTYTRLTEEEAEKLPGDKQISFKIPILRCFHSIKQYDPVYLGYAILADRLLATTPNWDKYM